MMLGYNNNRDIKNKCLVIIITETLRMMLGYNNNRDIKNDAWL